MANRNLPQSTMRGVTDVVAKTVEQPTAPDTSKGVGDLLAGVAKDILVQNEQAKITENMSQLQLDLGQAELEYKTEFASDPTAGFAQYKKTRQKLVEKYSDQISPLYRGKWNESVKSLTQRNDGTQQKWVYTQTRKNSLSFVNKAIENNINQAMRDGIASSESAENDVDAFVNFANSFQNIEKYAVENLGEAEANALLDSYQEDYIKSFVSGVAFNNPSKAIELLNDDEFQKVFSNPEQFEKMKSSFDIRAKRMEKAQASQARMSRMYSENALQNEVFNMNYAQQQQYFAENNVSEPVKNFYEQMSGYADSRKAVKGREKVALKTDFNLMLSQFISNDDMKEADIEVMQEAIYKGMSKKVFTDSEGFGYINQLMMPIIEGKQEQIKQFRADNTWNRFDDKLGFDSLNAEIELINGKSSMDERSIGSDDRNMFMTVTNDMYDGYLGVLGIEAQTRGITIAGLTKLPKAEKQKIYRKALRTAKEEVIRTVNPEFALEEELPATNVKPVPPTIPDNLRFKSITEFDKYREKNSLKDGTQVMVGSRPATWNN